MFLLGRRSLTRGKQTKWLVRRLSLEWKGKKRKRKRNKTNPRNNRVIRKTRPDSRLLGRSASRSQQPTSSQEHLFIKTKPDKEQLDRIIVGYRGWEEQWWLPVAKFASLAYNSDALQPLRWINGIVHMQPPG